MCNQGSPSTISPWLSRICFGAVGSYGCRQTAVAPAVCREQVVVSELLVPTPLESEMMSLVSPALLSVNIHALEINWNWWSFDVKKAKLGVLYFYHFLPRYWSGFLHNFIICYICIFFNVYPLDSSCNTAATITNFNNTRLCYSYNYKISWMTGEMVK